MVATRSFRNVIRLIVIVITVLAAAWGAWTYHDIALADAYKHGFYLGSGGTYTIDRTCVGWN